MATGSATLPAIGTAVAGKIVDGKIIQYMQPDIGGVDASSPVTSSNPMPVTGTFYPDTQPVSGTFWQETQPVSGSVVVSELTSGSVAVTSLPAVDETTGANLKASLRIYDNASEIYDEPMMVERALNVNVTNPSVTVSGAVDISATSFVHDASEAVYVGASESRTPKFAVISAASSGNNTIVGAVANKKLRVLALTLSFSGAVNAKFQSGAGGTDKTGLYYGTTNTAIVLPYNKLGWFETAASALLNLNLSGAVAVGGCLTYIEV